MKCDLEVNPLKCTQKGPQKWLCGKCNYKGLKLHRLFGHWPIEAFKGLDAATAAEFWRNTNTSNADIQRQIIDMISKITKEKEMESADGKYQPLGYWQTLGYDVEMIKNNTPAIDQKDHKQLGRCYRVVILKDQKANIESMVRTQTMSKKRAPKNDEDKSLSDNSGGNM